MFKLDDRTWDRVYQVHVLVNNIPGIEEVNMIKDDGSVIHFNNPKVSYRCIPPLVSV